MLDQFGRVGVDVLPGLGPDWHRQPEPLNVRQSSCSRGFHRLQPTVYALCVGAVRPPSLATPIIYIVPGPIREAFAKRCCGVHSR